MTDTPLVYEAAGGLEITVLPDATEQAVKLAIARAFEDELQGPSRLSGLPVRVASVVKVASVDWIRSTNERDGESSRKVAITVRRTDRESDRDLIFVYALPSAVSAWLNEGGFPPTAFTLEAGSNR